MLNIFVCSGGGGVLDIFVYSGGGGELNIFVCSCLRKYSGRVFH